LRIVGGEWREDGDTPHALALLRVHRERPRSCAAEQGDELSPFQLIKLHQVSLAKGTA
jgi:hypothetical protein